MSSDEEFYFGETKTSGGFISLSDCFFEFYFVFFMSPVGGQGNYLPLRSPRAVPIGGPSDSHPLSLVLGSDFRSGLLLVRNVCRRRPLRTP